MRKAGLQTNRVGDVESLTAKVRGGKCGESACGTGMLVSDGASEKRCCCCCWSPCAQEGAENVEEETSEGGEEEERDRRA
ncbi:hypothetical protein LDENG_00113260 [Lucifuga dentata]|nr:hypothetical protein LDENG_00113260 [Lucifuga dentata]